MKLFCMIRNNDESGTSGTGKVLEGVIFPSGKCVVCWSKKTDQKVDSVSVFDSFDEFHKIHVGQHPTNKTEFIYYDIGSGQVEKDVPKEVKELGLDKRY